MTEPINIMRHTSVFDPNEHDYPVHVIGAGATGSRVFAALVELGMKQINVYDPDIVESHNLANQIYTAKDVGNTKVSGCARFARNKLGVSDTEDIEDFNFIPRHVTPSYLGRAGNVAGGVVFILTDTMKSRRDIFDSLTQRCTNAAVSNSRVASAPMLIIETRMGSTHGSIFTINPFDGDQRAAWRATLVDDTNPDLIELSPCGTALSVGTTASLIANYAVWQMMQFFVDPLSLMPKIDFFFKPTLTITSLDIAA